eukprot:9359856-Pyramimonas_sp.AAC.2
MDVLPKGQRARWKSLDSVSQFGWCGSAFLGGWWSDRHGYMHTFLLTAASWVHAYLPAHSGEHPSSG